MKHYHGLEKWFALTDGHADNSAFVNWLLDDLQDCHFDIYGQIENDQILLARLSLLQSSLTYESFDQRIDFVVVGPILSNDCVPLNYRLQGRTFAMTGRCSMISKVCGVDLYLQSTYSGEVGDIARHKLAISMKSLLQFCKTHPRAIALKFP